MQMIAPLISRPITGPSQTAPTNGGGNQGFQAAAAAQSATPLSAQGFSATANPALGNQTLSALLQTQEVSHSHGHGGGHHGAKSLMPDTARQETAASEEAQLMNTPKKLTGVPKHLETSDTDQTDQEETQTDENAEGEDDKQGKQEKKQG